MKPGYLVGGVVILFCVCVTAMALSGTVRRTVTFAEAIESGRTCEIYGEVVPDSAKLNPDTGHFSFRLREVDPEAAKVSAENGSAAYRVPETDTETKAEITVVSLKPKPSNFDQAQHVKAIGVVEDGQFSAHDLLIKCPSKYQGVDKPEETAQAGIPDLANLQ